MTEPDPETMRKLLASLDPFHTMSGRIASQYATLEHVIDQTIWALAEVEPAIGACITTQLGSTTARLKSIIALLYLREGSDPFIKLVHEFLQANHAIADLRNRTVHDAWSVTVTGEVTQLCVAIEKNKLSLEAKPKTIDGLEVSLKKVSAQMCKAVALCRDIREWLATSPQKWREKLPEVTLGELVHLASET